MELNKAKQNLNEVSYTLLFASIAPGLSYAHHLICEGSCYLAGYYMEI